MRSIRNGKICDNLTRPSSVCVFSIITQLHVFQRDTMGGCFKYTYPAFSFPPLFKGEVDGCPQGGAVILEVISNCSDVMTNYMWWSQLRQDKRIIFALAQVWRASRTITGCCWWWWCSCDKFLHIPIDHCTAARGKGYLLLLLLYGWGAVHFGDLLSWLMSSDFSFLFQSWVRRPYYFTKSLSLLPPTSSAKRKKEHLLPS